MKRVLIIATAMILAACSTMRRPVPQQELSSQKQIAVVSTLGNQFHGIHVGVTVFGNSNYEAVVSDWNIDEKTEQFLVKAINRPDSRSAFPLAHDAELGTRLEASKTFTSGFDYKEITEIAKSQGADTVLIVQGIRYENAPFYQPGYGFYSASGGLNKKTSCVYSLFTLSAYSTITGAQLGWEWGFPACNGDAGDVPYRSAFEDFTADEKELLEKKVELSIQANLKRALEILGY